MASQIPTHSKTLKKSIRGPDSISRRGNNAATSSRNAGSIRPLRTDNCARESNGNPPYETDPVVLVRRQKQIDYGKNTAEYQNFISAVPKAERTKAHPKTPDRYSKCSRRCWDGQIKVWRLLLHAWEPSQTTLQTSPESNDPQISEEEEIMYELP